MSYIISRDLESSISDSGGSQCMEAEIQLWVKASTTRQQPYRRRGGTVHRTPLHVRSNAPQPLEAVLQYLNSTTNGCGSSPSSILAAVALAWVADAAMTMSSAWAT